MDATRPILSAVPTPALLRMEGAETIRKLGTARNAMRLALRECDLDQEDVADALRIDGGEFCRMVKEPKHAGARPRNLPLDKVPAFCRVTGSLALLQYLAEQVGMQVVPARVERSTGHLRAVA